MALAREDTNVARLRWRGLMATKVHLTPELEHFARKCVKRGRYNDVSEVVRAGLRLLQEAEERRRQFGAMLREVEEEADREGTFTVDSVLAEMDEIIEASKR
jgi:antitoxin ParD1/3/4